MIYSAKLLNKSETVHILGHRLGQIRNWGDFLADCIRGHQHIEGITLMPRARLQGVRGFGPAYDVADIGAFIRAVKLAVPEAGKKITGVTAQLDTCKGWRVTKIDRNGNSVARHQGMRHVCAMPRFITA